MDTAVGFINTVHLDYTEFIKQYEIKSGTREMMQSRVTVNTRCMKLLYNTIHRFTANLFFMSRKIHSKIIIK